MKITEHFTLDEFILSDYAIRNNIDNTPSSKEVTNIIQLCITVLEPLRKMIGSPMKILSGYRCPTLNTAIGGASSSQHIEGKAADIIVSNFTTEQLFNIIRYSDIQYDQLIQEFNRWVHISFDISKSKQRGEKLLATKDNSRTIYTKIT